MLQEEDELKAVKASEDKSEEIQISSSDNPQKSLKGDKKQSSRRQDKKGDRRHSRKKGKYTELLKKSTEIEKEITTIGDGKYSTLDEYSVNDKLFIFQSELIDQIKLANEYKDSLQRIAADFDNYRKRTEKDRENIIKYANEGLLLKLLEVLDNFDRALNNGKNGVDIEDPFYKGVKLIYNHFDKIMSEQGLKAIDETDVAFDPFKHDAMMQIVNNKLEDNTVTDVFLKGYFLKDRVIRPAQVRISKKEE